MKGREEAFSNQSAFGRVWIGMLPVLVILTAVTAALHTGSGASRNERHTARVTAQMLSFDDAISRYQCDFGVFPETLDDLVRSDGDSLRTSGYIPGSSIPKDPWGNDFRYRLLSEDVYEIASAGKDGLFDTKDDVSSKRQGFFWRNETTEESVTVGLLV